MLNALVISYADDFFPYYQTNIFPLRSHNFKNVVCLLATFSQFIFVSHDRPKTEEGLPRKDAIMYSWRQIVALSSPGRNLWLGKKGFQSFIPLHSFPSEREVDLLLCLNSFHR